MYQIEAGNRRAQRGLSLVELMVALLIAALVLSAVVGLFQQSKSSALQDEQVARMQENGRFALRAIARDLSMAGYFSTMIDTARSLKSDSLGSITNDCSSNWAKTLGNSLEFANDSDDKGVFACIADTAANVADDNDILAVKRVADEPDREYDKDGNATGPGLVASQVYLKTNGAAWELYAASGTSDTGASHVPNVLSSIHRYLPRVYYVRSWSATAGDGIPTLVRVEMQGSTLAGQPLVDGVERLHIEFGIDDEAAAAMGIFQTVSPDYYVAAPTTTELATAVTARVYLLLRSPARVTGYVNDKTYTLGSLVLGPFNDAYYRRVYATTVRLNNSPRSRLLVQDS